MYIVDNGIALRAAEEVNFSEIMQCIQHGYPMGIVSKEILHSNVSSMEQLYRIINKGGLSSGRFMTVWKEDTGILLGVIIIEQIDWKNGVAEIGLFPYSECRELFATALKNLALFCFDEIRMESVIVNCVADDEIRCQICEHAGFVKDVILRSRMIVNEEFKDIAIYTYTMVERENEKATL